MSGTKIKICGLTRPEDIAYANQAKPDAIGFVFFEKSRRYVTEEAAAKLKSELDENILAVGVFVDAPLEKIVSLLERNVIDIAQLHGNETEEDIQYLQAVTGKEIMKAVKVRDRYDVEAWLDTRADYLLFDNGQGTGQSFDWSLLSGVERDFFLAGGLDSTNLSDALRKISPFGVDLSSGVETEGKKDLKKMQEAVRMVREF